MLSKLHIEGLKGFARREDMRLAPITLVFGANSAGKSSLLQALLLLKQTLDSSTDATLRTSGELVDLGGYANLVHGHDVSRALRLGVEVSDEGGRRPGAGAHYGASFLFGQQGAGAVVRELELQWGTDAPDAGLRAAPRPDKHARDSRLVFETLLAEWPPAALQDWLCRVLGARLEAPPTWTFCRERAIAAGGLDLRRDDVAWDGFDPRVVREALAEIDPRLRAGSPGEIAAARWLPSGFETARGERDATQTAIVAALDAAIERTTKRLAAHLAGIRYLGPTREIPARIFSLRGLHGLGRSVVEDPGLVASVNAHLATLEVPYRLDPVRVGEDDPLIEDTVALQLIDTRYPEQLRVNVADVGVGVSQLLPFVTAAVASVEGMVIVEQPELHIHPGLQARLAEVIVAEAHATQFIVETHSEHLMLRLLGHVRQGRLDPADIAVLFVEHVDSEGARVHQLQVDEAGEFVQRWPGGFFTEREAELVALDGPVA
jgi:hypothetical protein